MEAEDQEPKHKKAWHKGRGRRSKARIGQKRKHKPLVKQPALVEDTDISFSHWSESLDDMEGWINASADEELRFCQLSRQDVSECSPLVVSRSLIVNKQDDSWMLHINGHGADPVCISSLFEFPSCLNRDSTTMLLQTVPNLNTCVGNPESMFIELGMSKKNHQFLSSNKEITPYVDTEFTVTVGDQQYSSTVRCSDCHLLTESNRCCVCTKYRHNLSVMCSHVAKNNSTVEKKLTVNYRYSIHVQYITLLHYLVYMSMYVYHFQSRFMKTPERLSALRAAKQCCQQLKSAANS
jgi:hypothetical protein